MEKKYRFLASILWLLFTVRLDAREDKNQIVFERQFTCVPNTQVFTQIDQFQDATSFDLTPPQFSTFSSTSQDWYQQYRQFLLNNVVGMPLQGKIIKITPEDIALIDRICKDNPHKDQNSLRMQLSQSSAFNYAQHFLKGDLLLHAFAPDIFIDLAHFKQVSAANYRMKQLQQAAKDAMQDRHKREKGRLESQQKVEINAAKKLSKSEKKKVESRHKQEWTALENKQKEENKHPLGVKNKTIQKSFVAAPVQQKENSSISQSTIPIQDLQNLRAQHQLVKLDGSSLQKVMEKRSVAIESSIKNQIPIVQSIQINSQTVARMAELAGGAAMPTPNLSCVVDQVLSLRPVITSVQNASGEMVQSFYLMTKNQLQKVWHQSAELLQLPEFVNFNATYQKVCGFNFFDILPKSNPSLIQAFADGLEIGAMNSAKQAALRSLFTQAEESVIGDVVKSGVSQIGSQLVQNILSTDFLTTEVGKNMLEVMTKPYEQMILNNVAKEYNKLIANEASQETIHTFCRCHELSIVPKEVSADIERLHAIFKDTYLGLPEFSSENPYLTIQMRHIFYPSLQPKLDGNNQMIQKINLNGFHHDESAALEKSGMLEWRNKIYGKTEFGAEEFFMADSDWGQDIICNNQKTFFPSSWSREKVAQVIFEAAQNRIEDITEIGNPNKKFLTQISNLFIEIVINPKNIIISAYPSIKNF